MNQTKLLPVVQAALDELKIEYKVLDCDPDYADTAAFCEHYKLSPKQAANTILVASKKIEPVKYAICVVLATTKLDVNKKVCQLIEAKRASFADSETTKSISGMMIGGVTVFGIKNLPIYVDSQVLKQTEVVMGGGNRSSKVLLDPKALLKIKEVQVIDGLAKEIE